jgi:hypothetical protein|tara:strand:- start:301 stop:846 length:546 start_codon:yes stop_codon:yes gene_type:complete
MSLLKIQSELKAPKNQFNSFGKYKYRSTEDILEAVKPLLLKYECDMIISDSIKEIGGIIYCESKIKFIDKDDFEWNVCASAGIDSNRKGMDISQSFGSSSSYARKYALQGLFLLCDTKDADATNMHDAVKMVEEKLKPILKVGTELFDKCRAGYLKDAKNLTAIQERYSMNDETFEALTAK